jgi:heterodisulfide reductase subunit B
MNATLPVGAAASTPSLADAVLDATGQNAYRCYQCLKCTSGCPMAEQFDLAPNQVMRSLQLDDTGVLESRTIWLCASCQTCTTRCPMDIDVAGIMDALCVEAKRREVAPAVPEIAAFNRLFMAWVKPLGRLYELGFSFAFNLARRRPFADMALARALFRRGRIKLMPRFARPPKRVEPLAAPSPRAVGFFPGCALDSSAIEYGQTVRATARALDVELVEPPGWQCCGSGPAAAVDPVIAKRLSRQPVTAVSDLGLDTLTTPCSKCFARLKHAEHGATEEAGGDDGVVVQHFLDTLLEKVGLDDIANHVEQPLKGLKVACYYGCLMTRPTKLTGAANPEYPIAMDELMRTLGAEPVEWSFKTECCGGALGVSQTALSIGLSRKVIDNAVACGAEAIVTMCPMCHMNLDARQPEMELDDAVPILHATQLAVLAFGDDGDAAALDGNVVDPWPLLGAKALL